MKKKMLFLWLVLCLNFTGIAQGIQDALRYSNENFNGTARYTALGGAFGALGGDLSALHSNPAASSVFAVSQVGITANHMNKNLSSSFLGNETTTDNPVFDIGQLGGVFVFNDTSGMEGWTKLSVAFNYQKNAYYNDDFSAFGFNPNGIEQYFLHYADGLNLEYLQTIDNETIEELYQYLGEEPGLGYGAQQALLGFQSFVLEPNQDTPTNNQYFSNTVANAEGYEQDVYKYRDGNQKKYTFNFSAAYNNRLHLGISLNSHRIEYSERMDFYEVNYTASSTIQAFRFQNEIYSQGEGISFQLGMLYKLLPNVRFGLAYDSPTWFRFNEINKQFVVVDLDSDTTNDVLVIDPQVDLILPEYWVHTPAQIKASFAYIAKDKGFISAEIGRKSFRQLAFGPRDDDYFTTLNGRLRETLQDVTLVRLGGEYRIEKAFLRAGYINESSSVIQGDNARTVRSYGLGYDFGNSLLDFSLQFLTFNQSQPVFQNGLTDPIELSHKQMNIALTYSLKL